MGGKKVSVLKAGPLFRCRLAFICFFCFVFFGLRGLQQSTSGHERLENVGEQPESPSNFSIRIIIFDNAPGSESRKRGWEELGCSPCGLSRCHVRCAVTHTQLLLIIFAVFGEGDLHGMRGGLQCLRLEEAVKKKKNGNNKSPFLFHSN